jgi:hypothetical protein
MPGTELPSIDEVEDVWRPTPTALQRQLAEWWLADLASARKTINGEPAAVVILGDVTHGDRAKYPDKELVSDRPVDQVLIAMAALEPLVEWGNLKGVRLAKGTGSHVGGKGSTELSVASRLQAKGIDAAAWYHMELSWGGVTLDLAHHGPSSGIREWTKGNMWRYYVRSIQDNCSRNGREIPGAVIRGHFHERIIEHVPFFRQAKTDWTWGILAPAYCGIDDFARKVTRSRRLLSVGMLLLEIHDGRLVWVHELLHGMDMARKEMW